MLYTELILNLNLGTDYAYWDDYYSYFGRKTGDRLSNL